MIWVLEMLSVFLLPSAAGFANRPCAGMAGPGLDYLAFVDFQEAFCCPHTS